MIFISHRQTQMYRGVEAKKFLAGDYIIRQGQSFGQHVFVIIKGQVSLISSSPQTQGVCDPSRSFTLDPLSYPPGNVFAAEH